jgi:hypothetical protein
MRDERQYECSSRVSKKEKENVHNNHVSARSHAQGATSDVVITKDNGQKCFAMLSSS